MIYTSYFGKLKSLPKNIVPVAICGKLPPFYSGAWYKKLAPSWFIWRDWSQSHDEAKYIESFSHEILDNLNPHEVVKELNEFISKIFIFTS